MTTSTTLYNDTARQDQETVIVFGNPRGGTSMVAGCLTGLGMHMGNNLPQNYEDPEFVAKPKQQMLSTIERKNKHHDVWGWKFPEAGRYLDELLSEVRNPRFVVVFRDLIAISNRQNQANNVDFERALAANSLLMQQNMLLVMRARVPTMLVSYEKAIGDNEGFLSELCDFSGLELPEDLSELINFMTPGEYKSTFADRYVA